MKFWPDASYFDSAKFSAKRLAHLLKAKAVLCPGLTIKFHDKSDDKKYQWCYEDGLTDYLKESVKDLR